MHVNLTYKNYKQFIFRTILALLIIAGVCSFGVAQAAIVYTGSSSGANNALPTNATAGPLTILKPAGTVAGQALIASIAARPSGMTVTVPAGWFAMTVTQQPSGGVSTLPGGMTLLTYYHIVGTADPASYTWTFANPVLGTSAGSAVGGLLAFSGIDTSSGNPINVWSDKLTASGLTHSTTSITPTLTNTMIVSSISYLSGDSFANPTGIAGITERLDQRAPAAVAAVGTTLQMSTAPWATATATGSSQAVAASNADTGVGHLMALKPAAIDPGITMTRSGPLNPGGAASYTMTVNNNGINAEPGPISVVDTLPVGLSYNATGSGGTGWVCGAVGQVVTCTRAGALAGGATAAALLLNVNVGAGATGTLTNTATVSGTGGDGNMSNNTATDSYTIAVDLALTMSSSSLNPGQSGTYTIDVSNLGTAPAPSPITVTDTLPAGLTYVSGAGTGWVCSAVAQAVTCTRASSLATGAAAGTLTLTVAVGQTAFAFTNTATVSGTAADSDATNNSASVAYNASADLSMTMARGANLVPGTNATYTLNVTNAGPNTAPQPIIISDTLPAGLTYVSGVGPGWACVVGPPVTCTLTGTLASGATSSLVLTVSVSAGASGTITNTATVAGTAIDSTPANNTATDSYTIALSTYAYYKMDEASWTGAANEVLDSSGNNRNASRVGGATVTTVAAPASGLKGDTCKDATIPSDTSAATQMGVNTPINPNALGNAGTVSFWYKNNVAWTANGNNNDRTLLDATGATNAGEFWLVLQQTGDLRFMLDNAGGAAQTITGAAKAFAVNTWHHIAISWNFTAHTMFIYVDGVQDATRSNNNVTSATTNYGTFFLGDSKTNRYTNPNRGNSANGYLDEVRIYNSALTAAQVTADMNATHACGVVAPDHIRIEHDGVAISCVAEAVVVKACANPSCSILYTSGVTGILSAGNNSVPFAILNGQSQATVSIHLPTSSALADPQIVRMDASSVSPVPTDPGSAYCSINGGTLNNTTSCDMSVSKAGFIFNVPNLTSGTASGSVNISAVRSSDSSTCVPLFKSVTRTVAVWGNYQNPATGTLGLQLNGSVIETLVTTATPAYTSTISLTFDASGVASLTSVQYDDVGLMQLNARYLGDTANTPPDGGMIVTGSDTFVVKPDHFVLSGIQQTAAPNQANQLPVDATGNKFVMAGEPFTVIVTAKNALGATTANYGQESTPESVRFVDTSLLPTDINYANHGTLVAGLGLIHNPAIGGGFGDFGTNCAGLAGTLGTACSTDFTWNEVGIIKLTPSVGDGDYLGAGDVTGTQTGNIGRFYPDHFDTVMTAPMTCAGLVFVPVCPPPGNGLVYSGQSFGINVQAKNASNQVTQNYAYSITAANNFARAVALSAVDGSGGAVILAGVGSLTAVSVASSQFSSGETAASLASPIFTFASSPTNPTNVFVRATETAGDAVTSLRTVTANSVEGGVKVVSGRIKMSNAYGSELLPLPMTATVQFFNTAGSWVTSSSDTVTAITNSDFALGFPVATANMLAACETALTVAGISPNFSINLSRPGVGNNGWTDLTLNLGAAAVGNRCTVVGGAGAVSTTANRPWLQFPVGSNPTARATFGVYKGNNNFIYQRENY